MKRFLFVFCTFLLFSFSNASALTLSFDTEGQSGAGNVIDIATFDWAPSSAVTVGSNGSGLGDTFTLYTHGTASILQDGSSTSVGGILLANKEITFVTGFSEKIITDTTDTFGSFQRYSLDATSQVNFFNVYIDDIDADSDLNDGESGKGFSDGTLLFSGTITSSTGSFASNFGELQKLDSFGSDDASNTSAFGSSNQLSVTGGGATYGLSTNIKFTNFNTDYFYDLDNTAVLSMLFNTSSQNVLPFNHVDPSTDYWTGSGYYKADIGDINGSPTDQSGKSLTGKDVIFEMDASTSVVGVVPEPGTIALFGFGLLTFAGIVRRKV